MDIPPPLTGTELEQRLKEKIVQVPLADGLLYQGASVMFSSQPSVGKSVLAVQAAYELSIGAPLFGALVVHRPLRVWYMQMERPVTESLERLQLMRGESTVSLANLFIDSELQALNFIEPIHLKAILERGKEIQPDIIFIDPIYCAVIGLSKDEVAASFSKVLTVIKKTLNCALWINHHTTKITHEIIEGRKVEKDDPYYGAQWLKAHVTGSYFVREKEKRSGVIMLNKKDSHGCLIRQIETSFDPDTYLSTMKTDNLTYIQRYKLFINSHLKSGNLTYFFEDAVEHLGCTIGVLRTFHRTQQFLDSVTPIKTNGHKTLYKITKEIV